MPSLSNFRVSLVLTAVLLLITANAGAQSWPSADADSAEPNTAELDSAELDSAEPETAEALLAALKHALVDAAQEQTVNVTSNAYIDASGQLVESNFFDTQATVRGVRVLEYLPSPPPDAASAHATLPDSLKDAHDGVCAVTAPTQYRPTLLVSAKSELGEGRVNASQAAQIAQAARLLMDNHGALNLQWELVHDDPQVTQLSEYDRLLTGKVAFDDADYELSWTLSTSAAAGSDNTGPVSTARRLIRQGLSYTDSLARVLVSNNPLLPIDTPGADSAVTLYHQITLINRRNGESLHTLQFEDTLAADTSQLRSRHTQEVADIVSALAPQLDNFMRDLERTHACQLRQIPLLVQRGEPTPPLQMRLGTANDAKLGDRFLLIETPWQGGQQTLNTNLVGSLSIGEIVQIDRYLSTVQIIAGNGSPADLTFALPF